MQLHACERLDQYQAVLKDSADEAQLLFNDLLISVTNFFRDEEVFDHLEREIIPALLDGRGPDDTVRVWSVGCSTGEEAYSIAMLLLEATARMAAPPMIQVFATDLHDVSLRRAREGLYPELIGSNVSPERLHRFFVRETDGYRVRKDVREVVVFAPHDLLRDPPFSHIDLVSCRNLLIYLQRELQRQVIELFHYALDPGGVLVLGTSESVDRSELFAADSEKKLCIFRRRDVTAPDPRLPVFTASGSRRPALDPPSGMPARGFGQLHEKMVERYAPPSVLVNGDQSILHYSDQAGAFLVHPGGEPTTDIVRLVRDELRIELRAALYTAKEQGAPSTSRPVKLVVGGEARDVVIRVRPADDDSGLQGLYLVIFDDVRVFQQSDDESASSRSPQTELETELDITKQRLQALIEEYEVSQEEMKASNEEMQSTNEELRSTLEELETSKEELQSVNEELTTLNQENRHKVEELRILSGDLQNLLIGTDIATLFLDRQLRIMRFTPRVGELFNIRNSDRGRPLSDLTHQLGYANLNDDAHSVLDRLVPIEREVQSYDERWFLSRVLPYRTSDDRIDGVVITFIDITRRRRAELALADSEQRLRLALAASRMGAWTLDLDSDEFTYDERVAEIFGLSPEGGTDLPTIVGEVVHPDDRPALQTAISQAAAGADGAGFSVEARLVGRRSGWVLVSGKGYVSRDDPDNLGALAGTVLDITDRKETEEALERRVADKTREVTRTERRYRALVEASSQVVWNTDSSGRVVDDSPQWREFTGQSVSELEGEGWLDAVDERDRGYVREAWFQAIESREPFHAEFRIRHAPTESSRWVSVRAVHITDADGTTSGWVAMMADIDERRRAEEKVRSLASTLTMAEHEERRRIAGVLHDDLQQQLYSVQMRSATLRDGLTEPEHAETVGRLREIEEWLARSIEATRNLAVELSPPILEHEGLTETISWLSSQMMEMHGLRVDVSAEESVRIADDDMRVFLFQIIRELLFNVVKHAEVDSAIVELACADDVLEISVRDDGAGFTEPIDDRPRSAEGMGLTNVRERLALFGGSLEIHSVPGDGSTVSVTLPIDSDR